MREPELKRQWRRAVDNSVLPRLARLRCSGVLGLEDSTVQYEAFATLIVGGNGTGKSSLLAITRTAVDETLVTAPKEVATRLQGATLEVEVVTVEGFVTLRAVVDETGNISRTRVTSDGVVTAIDASTTPLMTVTYLELASQAREVKELFAVSEARRTLMEGVDARLVSSAELEQINWRAQKSYRSVNIYEVTKPSSGENADDAIVPYFVVEEGTNGNAIRYGSESMGTGELCLLLFHWNMSRLERGTLVLMDEPEASLPPSSQKALVRSLPGFSLNHGAGFVLSTHSDHVIDPFPEEYLRVLYRADGSTRIMDQVTHVDILETLELATGPRTYVLVEDAVAAQILKALMMRSPRLYKRRILVVRVSSSSVITKLIDQLPCLPGIRIVGVYDGDEATKGHKAGKNASKTFLPLDGVPEAVIRALVSGKKSRIARIIGTDLATLNNICDRLSGRDAHDWLLELAHRIGTTVGAVIDAALSLFPKSRKDKFALRLRRVIDLNESIENLREIAALDEADRPSGPTVKERIVELEATLSDSLILVGSNQRQEAEAAIKKLRAPRQRNKKQAPTQVGNTTKAQRPTNARKARNFTPISNTKKGARRAATRRSGRGKGR